MAEVITWSDGAPGDVCYQTGAIAVDIVWGYPTYFRCRAGDQVVSEVKRSTPSCPSGFIPEFRNAVCVSSDVSVGLPFDSATAGAFFGFAFASTMFLWLLSHGLGWVLNAIKSRR